MRSLKETDDLVKKWEPIGLLEYPDNHKMTAYCLEHAVKLLDTSSINGYNGMIIPIVFRIVTKINLSTRREAREVVKMIIEEFSSFFNENRYLIQDIMTFSSIDWEVEMCQLFSKQFLYKYENR